MTEQGQKILDDFYKRFRESYLKDNARSNENDVERAFLITVAGGLQGDISIGMDDLKAIKEIQ